MSEKIIIDIDDIHEDPAPEKRERIVIDFSEEENAPQEPLVIDKPQETLREKIESSAADSFFRGNASLNGFCDTSLEFPEGIDQSFGVNFRMKLGDEFLSSLLVTNKHVVAASKNGTVYLADRFDGMFCDKIRFDGETFEKTGVVHGNKIYLSSPRRIFGIDSASLNTKEELYCSPEGSFIWSSLNRFGETIVFAEYSPTEDSYRLNALSLKDGGLSSTPYLGRFRGDLICICGPAAYSVHGSRLIAFDLETLSCNVHDININCGESPYLMSSGGRLFVTSHSNEVYVLDLPPLNYNFRFTGIRNTFMNSMAGFADNLFIGTLEGWKFFKSGGVQVYSFEDEYENRIEAVSRNVLVISQKNKVVFVNLNRFQEAESVVISGESAEQSVEVISTLISHRDIYTVTSNGILTAFTNDKMNIHI